MTIKTLVLHLLLLLTIFTIPGQSTFLRDARLGKSEPVEAQGSALHLKATDKVTGILEKLVKPTASDLGENLLAQAKGTVESVLQHKDEFLAKAKDKVGTSLKTLEDEGSTLLTKAKEKVGSSLQQNEEILAKAKEKVGSSLQTIEQEGSELLSKAKVRMENRIQEKDELVAKAKGKIGALIEKKEAEEPKPYKESSLLQRTKDKIHSSFKTIEEEGSSFLNKAKEKGSVLLGKAKDTVENSAILRTIEQGSSDLLAKTKNLGQVEEPSPQKDDTSLLAKAKETVENSLLMRTLTKGEGSLLSRAKEKVEKSLLGKSLKESENFLLTKARENVQGAKKFNLLSAKPFNSLFSNFGTGTPKISGLKFLYPMKNDEVPVAQVDDFQYPEKVEPKKEVVPEVCYSRPPPKEEEPVVPVLPENLPLDYDKIEEGYYQDSRQFQDESESFADYEEVEPEIGHEEFSRFSNDDYYPEEYSEGLKGQKRHASYDRLFRRPKPKRKGTEEKVRERFNRGLGNMKKLIGIAGQVDSFLTGKIRTSLRTLTNLVESEDDYKNGSR